MAGHERQQQPGDRGKEQELRPAFLDVRRFPDMETAGRAYGEAQQALQRDAENSDVSIYRIQTGPELTPHVVALGDPPGAALAAKLEVAFALGERVTLDADVVAYLVARREEAKGLGPWIEGHHRPGQPVWLEHQPRRDGGKQREHQKKQRKQAGRRSRDSWKKKRH